MAVQWFVVFCEAESLPAHAQRRDRLLHRLLRRLRPGFRHCYAFRARGDGAGWVVVNPNATRLDVVVTGDGSDQDAFVRREGFDDYGVLVASCVEAGHARVLVVTARQPVAWIPRGAMNCVTVVKHLLGLEAPWWVMTPFQLHRWLEREMRR